jgi:hypothetical protein
MPGLDPGIHQERNFSAMMDCRVKPGNDGRRRIATRCYKLICPTPQRLSPPRVKIIRFPSPPNHP